MWSGDHPDWPSALAACRPFPSTARTVAYERAWRAVRDGQARYERDGILKHDLGLDWPLVAALAWSQRERAGDLVVLDIGGALASVFWQHRRCLDGFASVRWAIVEKEDVVAAGRRLVDDPRVRFFDSIDAAVAEGVPDVIVASALLPMIPDPYGLLDRIAAIGARRVFLDRISVVDSIGRDHCTRQVVPRSIYESESPFWFFDAAGLEAALASRFRILGESASASDRPVWVLGRKCRWVGYLLEPLQG